jgi:hypothetical protein
MIAPFGQRQARPTRFEHFEYRGRQRCALGFEHQLAARKDRGFVAAQVARQRCFVDFLEVGARRDDPMQKRTVVGHQEQTSRVAVEPADSRERGRTSAKARRQQIVDQRAGIPGRAGVTRRLVQHENQAWRRIERSAVDADTRRLHDIVDGELVPIDIGDATLAKHCSHFLATAIADVGDQLEQLHARFAFSASTILKPCC